MRRRTRTTIAALALVASTATLTACGGRTDGGNPGNPAGDTSTTSPVENTTTIPMG